MQTTLMVRVPADLAVKLGAIAKSDATVTVAEIVDPLLRAKVEKLFDRLPATDREYALARIARLTGEPAATSTASAK